jgi:hypothetical protein
MIRMSTPFEKYIKNLQLEHFFERRDVSNPKMLAKE